MDVRTVIRSVARRRWIVTGALALALGSALGGCGDDDSGDLNNTLNNNNTVEGCPAGHSEVGPACVPVFDVCTAPNEKAVLGGGCEAVGVTQCATGFAPDGAGSCDPVLPADPCPAGTMPVLGETTCQPVGVLMCSAGFTSDGAGGCEPVLPAASCGDHELEVLGETACQPLGDCGTGTWGNIIGDGSTVYVDAGSTAGSPNGSQSNPFLTIGAALAVVSSGGQVAIAQGVYTESVALGQEVRLTGRCAELVTIQGAPAVQVAAGGSQSAIRGVTLSGTGVGLQVTGASQITVEEARIGATGGHGIEVEADGELSLSRVKVDQATRVAINFTGAVLDLFETVVQDTQSAADSTFGRGLYAICDASASCGAVTVDRSILQRNKDVTVYAKGADLTVTDSLVRDSLYQVSDQAGGWGIGARCDPVAGVCGTLAVEGTAMLDNPEQSFTVIGVHATVNNTTIRRTEPNAAGNFGTGLTNFCDPDVGDCGSLLFVNSVIDGSYDHAAFVFGPVAVFRGVILQNTAGWQANGQLGVGLDIECFNVSDCGSVTMEDSLIETSHTSGVLTNGPEVTIRRTVVRDTESQVSDGLIGTGIAAQCDQFTQNCGGLTVDGCIVERNRMTGISVAGPDVLVRGSLVRDTMPQVGETSGGDGLSFGCDPVLGVCGNVRVEGCVIEDNRESGIIGGSQQLEIRQTVVRGTTKGEDPSFVAYAWGIALACDPRGNCGSVTVADTTVEENENAGIMGVGIDVVVERSIVRDTVLESDGAMAALGIAVGCTVDGLCGTVAIRDTIVESMTGVGIQFDGIDATLERSTLRHILASPNTDHLYSWGTLAVCSFDNPTRCGSLAVRETLFEQNESAALGAGGVSLVVESSMVRDTINTSDSFGYGFGLEAICYEGQCSTAEIRDSSFDGNAGAAVLVAGVATTIHRVSITQTASLQADASTASAGYGVVAFCLDGTCQPLEVTECVLESNATAALSVEGVSGFVSNSVITSVAANVLDGAHGYGVQIAGTPESTPEFNVNGCTITDASLAGLLFHEAGGVVSDTVIAGGDFPVVLSSGADANILDNNDLSGNLANEPTWTTMEPAPSPAPDEPVDISNAPELP
ncbi:MAG: right-handed parallel beta-helix repeat-containing protein [bacterium]